MEILIGVVIFVIGLAAESWLARYTGRREDEELFEYRLARYAGLRR
jgi:hypothetical protein